MENKYYASYDAADKTLARCFVKIEDLTICATRAYNRLNEFLTNYGPSDPTYCDLLSSCLKKVKCDLQFVNFYDYAVSDILHGKKVRDCTDLERSKMLKNHLEQSDMSLTKMAIYKSLDLKVIIEHQPAKINSKSPQIEHQLTMYYLCGDHNVIHVAGANKNKITISKSFETYLTEALAKISPLITGEKLRAARKAAKYAARKKHSKETFEEFCLILGYDHVLNSCKRAVLDDQADAFMQLLAYHFGHH